MLFLVYLVALRPFCRVACPTRREQFVRKSDEQKAYENSDFQVAIG